MADNDVTDGATAEAIEPSAGENVAVLGPSAHEPATLLANSAFLLLARLFTLLSGGALIIYATRTLSVESFGQYAVAIALITIFTSLSEMGISTLATREIAEGRREGRILGTALVAEALTSVAAVLIMLPFALLIGYSSEVIALLAIGSGVVLFQGLVAAADAVFKARRLFVYASVLAFVQSTVVALLGFLLLALGAGAAGLMTALVVAGALAVPLAFFLLRSRLGVRPELPAARTDALRFLRLSIPIALTGAVTVIYERVDVLLVSLLDSTEAAAIYGVPLTVMQYTLLIPAVIGTAFFPLLASTLARNAAEARQGFFLLSRLFLLGSVPIAMVYAAGSDEIVTLTFGEAYEESAGVLAVLAVSVVLGFQIYLLWYGLLAAHQERTMAAIMLVGLPLNVLLNIILVPPYGPTGAAWALIASDVVILGGQVVLIHRRVFAIPFGELIGKPLLAGVVSAPLVVLLLSVSGVLAGLVGGATYLAVLLVTRYVAGEEWDPLKQPFARAPSQLRRFLSLSGHRP